MTLLQLVAVDKLFVDVTVAVDMELAREEDGKLDRKSSQENQVQPECRKLNNTGNLDGMRMDRRKMVMLMKWVGLEVGEKIGGISRSGFWRGRWIRVKERGTWWG